jgi:beta-glucosidase/6-phospho-beta-glucosidase/beta-galactosidase
LLLLASCSGADPRFPSSFLFGTAVAGFQVEMGCPSLPREQCEDRGSDWYQWITRPELIADPALHLSGDAPTTGPGFFELYEQDLDRAKAELSSNAFRLSLEWSRIFPTATDGIEGYDALAKVASPAALAYYHALLAAVRARGLVPLVTLNHYTLPAWIHDAAGCHADITHCQARGWVDGARTVREIAKYAGFAAREFGGQVDLWATLNEPFTAVILAGYLLPSADRSNPPGVTLRWAEAKAALEAEMQAHAAMADAVHANDLVAADGGKPARVGLVFNLQAVSPQDPSSARDVQAAKNLDYLMNQLFLNGALSGDFDLDLSGHPVHRDGFAGKTDWLGINYYDRVTCAGLSQSLFPSEAPLFTFDPFSTQVGADATGLSEVLLSAKARGLPIFITETGLSDPDDSGSAAAWIAQTLSRTRAAMAQGVPVQGYFFWTLMDNYEWNHGMQVRLGLYAVDGGDPAKARRARPRAIAAFSRIARERRVPADLLTP